MSKIEVGKVMPLACSECGGFRGSRPTFNALAMRFQTLDEELPRAGLSDSGFEDLCFHNHCNAVLGGFA